MFTKNLFIAVVAFIMLSLVGCSENENLVQESNTNQITEELDPRFEKLYLDYNTSIVQTRKLLTAFNREDGTNPLIGKLISLSQDPDGFVEKMDKYYLLFNGKDLLEMNQILKEEEVINQFQLDYLNIYAHKIKEMFIDQKSKDYLLSYTIQFFGTENLNKLFSEHESSILRFIGVAYTQSILKIDFNSVAKSCENIWQNFVCGTTATLAALTAGAAGYVAGVIVETFSWCDEFLDFLGFDPLNIPNWLDQLLPDSITITEDLTLSTQGIICGAAVTIGVWEFAYEWCCEGLYGCDEEDPCCDVVCPPGYYCNGSGICIKNPPCFPHCDEGEICYGGQCIPRPPSPCDGPGDCHPFEEMCVDGICVPR